MPRWHLAGASVISFITLYCLFILSYFSLFISLTYRLWSHEGCGNLIRFSSWHLVEYLNIQWCLKCWPDWNPGIIVLIFKAGHLFIYGYSLHFSTRESGLSVETWHCHVGAPKNPVIGKKYIWYHSSLQLGKITLMYAPQTKECV